MGRLFWKFFAAFWVALATVAAVVATGIWVARWFDLMPTSRVEIARLNLLVDTASDLLQAGDLIALKKLNVAAPSADFSVPYAIDSHGHELTGRSVDAGLWARVRAAPDQEDPKQARTGLGLVRRVTTPNGDVATLFMPASTLVAAMTRFNRETPPPFWIPAGATILMSTLFGSLMAWYVSKPIRTLRWALRRLSAGQLDTRVKPLMGRRRDELAELGEEFDRMAQRTQVLVSSQQRLLHDVSHELRSPLARIQAAIGVARQQPDRVGAMQDRVERECLRLDELVGELLTLARLETDGPATMRDRIDVMELLAEVCGDARFEAQTVNRDLVFIASGDFWIEGRGDLLYRAFENVVRNAVKFTRECTVVTVAAETGDDGLVVTVTDHGPGVPQEAHAQMFEPFQRVGSAGTDGFGLGLTIAKRAIESHGGSIHAQAAPDGGLTIQIRLGAAVEVLQ